MVCVVSHCISISELILAAGKVQDSHEMLQFILETMQENMHDLKNSLPHGLRRDSVAELLEKTKIFSGAEESRIVCTFLRLARYI